MYDPTNSSGQPLDIDTTSDNATKSHLRPKVEDQVYKHLCTSGKYTRMNKMVLRFLRWSRFNSKILFKNN